jgi:hypothetical protein
MSLQDLPAIKKEGRVVVAVVVEYLVWPVRMPASGESR